MKASEILAGMPEGDERTARVMGAVREGHYLPITWQPITLSHGPYTALVQVSSDALRIGEPDDNVRVTEGHRESTLIADELWSVLPTTKISDEIWRQADLRIPPKPHLAWVNDRSMSRVGRMIEQSAIVDDVIASHGGIEGQLVADVGKDWVAIRRLFSSPTRSANYGWRGSNGVPLQPPGMAHGASYKDYSQVLRLVWRDVEVHGPDGQVTMDIEELVQDPELAPLISSEGVLPSLRHPAVSGQVVRPPTPPVSTSPPIGATSAMFPRMVMFAGGCALGFMAMRAIL